MPLSRTPSSHVTAIEEHALPGGRGVDALAQIQESYTGEQEYRARRALMEAEGWVVRRVADVKDDIARGSGFACPVFQVTYMRPRGNLHTYGANVPYRQNV